jgi:hypothetical protein
LISDAYRWLKIKTQNETTEAILISDYAINDSKLPAN